MKHYDIIIAGGGIVGLASALALAKNPTLKIAIIEKSIVSPVRVSAISLGSKVFFEKLGIWESLEVSPYQKMFVWDQCSHGEIEFDCKDVQEQALGYIVEDQQIKNALLKKINAVPNIDLLTPIVLEKISFTENLCTLQTAQELFSCKLMIGADGAQSWVREQTGINVSLTDYQHKAITATVKTELHHQQTAWQCFSASGPLAFLPLKDPHQCSIVWSTENDYANELLALDDLEFQERLNRIFVGKLGNILNSGTRSAFPLKMQHAKNYILPHMALIGDAAHVLHPLAGQGVNLGLQDAACLSSLILSNLEKNRSYCDLAMLRKYERTRKSENTIMLKTVDTLKSLFASERPVMASLRGNGLNFINKVKFMKSFLASYAIDTTL